MGRKIATLILTGTIMALIVLNLINCFVPEIGFDAIWYHLVLPKLWLLKHQWFFPGGLLYYSAMPRLAETMFIPLVKSFGFVGPKLLQFTAGILTCGVLVLILKKFIRSKLLILVGVTLFYATWLVSWESSSAYVDLIRTFFETLALYFLVRKTKLFFNDYFLAGIFYGLAVGTKWHALISLGLATLIFSPLVLVSALIVALPWFLIAFWYTNSPVYPLLERFMQTTQVGQVPANFYKPLAIAGRLITLPVILPRIYDDFISPLTGAIYLLSFPSLLARNSLIRKVALFGILGTIAYILIPPPSSRYFLPFFIPLITSALYLIDHLKEKFQNIFIFFCLLSALLILAMRLFASVKNIPYLLHQTDTEGYLTSQSAKLSSTFIDSDHFVRDQLPPKAKYLIGNLHNLYYFPYDFDHVSWMNGIQEYDYLITTNEDPSKYPNSQLSHTNPLGIQIIKLK